MNESPKGLGQLWECGPGLHGADVMSSVRSFRFPPLQLPKIQEGIQQQTIVIKIKL